MHIRKDIRRRALEGQVFLLPAEGSSLPPMRLNDTADRLLYLLAEDTTRDELLAALAAEYDAPREVLAADLDDFLARMRALELLVE